MANEPITRKEFGYFYEMTTRWRDNDVYNHVNNAVFFEFIDTGVNAWIKLEAGLDVPNTDMIGLVVNSSCSYHAPLSFPGRVTAGVSVARIGTSSVTYRVGLFQNDEDVAAALSEFTHVYVDAKNRKPMALPDPFRRSLEGILKS